MENMVKNENYYVVQGFMVKELKLKGLERDIYAIIYGFSQTNNQKFSGSLQYLADWTMCSKQGVLKALKSLEDKGLIARKENVINNIKFVEYYSTEFNTPIKLSLTPIKQSLTNNINNNKDNKIESNIYCEIIDYLNKIANVNFRVKSKETQRLINARLNDGFTVDDFKKVIQKKFEKWRGTKYEQYMRPKTLFGTNFESYLNESMNIRETRSDFTQRNYTVEEMNNLFDSLDEVEI